MNVMFHFFGRLHVLFELFEWIDTLPNVYFVIVLTFDVIHKMLLYVVQRVSPFFVGTLHFGTTLFATGFVLLFFDPKGRAQFFFGLVGLSFLRVSIGLACLFSSSYVSK
jgi:hypothetical protein